MKSIAPPFFKILWLFALCFVGLHGEIYSQSGSTTFIIVRHAEKDLTQSTNDPDLAPEGKERSGRLKEILKNAGVTEVYSTPFKRTVQTVKPLAQENHLEVNHYSPMEYSVFESIITNTPGAKVLVAGHSNTVPALLNFLTGTEDYKIMADEEYGRLYIVTANAVGSATVLELFF